jgi:phosphoglucomutase
MRIDVPAHQLEIGSKTTLSDLEPKLAGEAITAKLTRAPANNAEFGGLKVVTAGGWFAARPSGTEDICKIYTESFRSEDHLRRMQEEAMEMVKAAYQTAGV